MPGCGSRLPGQRASSVSIISWKSTDMSLHLEL
jgi:hypothetical protein